MDNCGCASFACVITACRCAREVVATLFLTQRSPSLIVHKSVLIPRLWLQVLGSVLALAAQTRPLLWHHIPVASVPPYLLLAGALDRLVPGVSRRWRVGEHSSA